MLLVNLYNLYDNDISHVNYVGNAVHALGRKLGNVYHSVLSGSEVYACAELSLIVFHNLGYDTLVHVADLYVTNDVFDNGTRLFDSRVVI